MSQVQNVDESTCLAQRLVSVVFVITGASEEPSALSSWGHLEGHLDAALGVPVSLPVLFLSSSSYPSLLSCFSSELHHLYLQTAKLGTVWTPKERCCDCLKHTKLKYGPSSPVDREASYPLIFTSIRNAKIAVL